MRRSPSEEQLTKRNDETMPGGRTRNKKENEDKKAKLKTTSSRQEECWDGTNTTPKEEENKERLRSLAQAE